MYKLVHDYKALNERLNISTIDESRYLVATGPYKYIRHPLYSIFCGIAIVMWLISSNWLIGLNIPIVIYTMILRIDVEEEILLAEYGDQYRSYSEKTNKLLPRIY